MATGKLLPEIISNDQRLGVVVPGDFSKMPSR